MDNDSIDSDSCTVEKSYKSRTSSISSLNSISDYKVRIVFESKRTLDSNDNLSTVSMRSPSIDSQEPTPILNRCDISHNLTGECERQSPSPSPSPSPKEFLSHDKKNQRARHK